MEHGLVFQTSQVHSRIEVRKMKLTFELMTFSCYSGFLLYICHLKAKEDTVTLPEDTPHWFLFTKCVSPASCQSWRRQKEWYTAAQEIMWESRSTGGKCKCPKKQFLRRQVKSTLRKHSKQTWRMEVCDSDMRTEKKGRHTKLPCEVWSGTFLFIKWLVLTFSSQRKCFSNSSQVL